MQREAAANGEPEDGSRYNECWLGALKRLSLAKYPTDIAVLKRRTEAYRQTPQGKPVELGTASTRRR